MSIFGKPRLLGRRAKRPAVKAGRNLISDTKDRKSELLEGEVIVEKEDGSRWARRYARTREGSYSERRLDSGDDA